MAWRFFFFFIICVGTIGAFCSVFANAELERFYQPAKSDRSLSFLVIGDCGRRGAYNQSQVALQMGRIGEKLVIDFVVSTGDNFYEEGLKNEYDLNFEESFSRIYTAKSLQKQWYSVLGNHDYRGDAEAQLSPNLRKTDRRWLCFRSFIVNAEIAEIFFVDTTPFVRDYFDNPEDHTYGWRAITPSPQAYINDLLSDLESALKKSSAKWKIVVGHHTIRSIGHHGNTRELIKHLLPILKEYDVDFYINGHDHCLEHIADVNSPIQYLTSAAGSKAWRGDVDYTDTDGVKFFYDGQGFMSVQLYPSDAEIAFYDVSGKVLHRWVTSKQFLLASI